MELLSIAIVIAVAVVLGLILAWVPLRAIVGTIAKRAGDEVRRVIRRRRDRRRWPRHTSDRRELSDPLSDGAKGSGNSDSERLQPGV